ncbi:MAG: hypothetical protein FH758_14910 [Firmicutes bacterium]|nr:hypothetical protein [Bacillota bacterium]
MPDANIVEIIKSSMNDPWLEILIVIWALGWILKNTKIVGTRVVPLLLVAVGMVLGLILIEPSLNGLLAGFVLSVFAIGSHSTVKNSMRRKTL